MSLTAPQQAPVVDLRDIELSVLRSEGHEIEESFLDKGYLTPQERARVREITRIVRAL